MSFFRKVDITRSIKSKSKGEFLSNVSIAPLENSTEEFQDLSEILGHGKRKENAAFEKDELPEKEEKLAEIVEEENRDQQEKIEDVSSKNISSDEKITKEYKAQSQRKNSHREQFRGKISKYLCHPNLIYWVSLILIAGATWGVTYSIAGAGFAPGSQLFSLLALFVLAFISGELIRFIKLPPLLGMLLIGLLLRNVGFIHLEGVYIEVTATLREIALCIILIRAGLGLDPRALKSLKFVILRLALVPGVVEGTITTVVTHYLLGLPWLWGLLLGAILAAVSPAVVIPCLFSLQEKGYGTGKGIPTLVVAAASLDDVFAITVFGVMLNVIYSGGGSVTSQIIQVPAGILIGIIFGIIWGLIAHFVPHQKDDHVVLLRVLIIVSGSFLAIVGSGAIGYQGAGPLGCIIAAFVACLGWRKQDYTDEHNPVADVFRVMWLIFQPILFGLIGSEVDVSVLEASTIASGLIALFCSLLGRIVISVFIGYGAGFNWKEKTFIAWAWFPKATVQAALGPLALDIARRNGSKEEITYAKKILILAVQAILITAPLGSALITILGPRLLTKTGKGSPSKEKTKEEVNLESSIENNTES